MTLHRLYSEEEIRAVLSEIYTPEGVNHWLLAHNKLLDGDVAMAMIRRGESDKVMAVIQAIADGVFL